MAHSARTLRIIAASFIALLMVGGAYVFSGPVPFLNANIAGAQSSAELLREYAAKDTDTDGLPDWQEALYGTDPSNPESFQAGIKDGEAVAQGLIEPKVMVAAPEEPTDPSSVPGTPAAPNSLTDRFAQSLLRQYLLNRSDTPPTDDQIVSFVEAAITDLSSEAVSADTFSAKDIRSSGTSGREAVIAYAAQVDSAFVSNTVATEKNELYYFSDALGDDAAALRKVKEISDAYADIAQALIAIPAPAEMRQAHLALANALMHMSEVTGDMAALKDDPLRALLGIGFYEAHVDRMASALSNMDGVFSALQVDIPAGAPGHGILTTARSGAEIVSRETEGAI